MMGQRRWRTENRTRDDQSRAGPVRPAIQAGRHILETIYAVQNETPSVAPRSAQHDSGAGSNLAAWYAQCGRHEIEWRVGASRWSALVAETMSCQTQIERVREALPQFLAQFPTPEAAAAAGQAALVRAWGRLGYPRRAQYLYNAACVVVATGWPERLEALPGVGPWVAAAVAAQVDDADAFGCDVNVRRVAQRFVGTAASDRTICAELPERLRPMRGRALLLAVVDLGALVCTRSNPACEACPLSSACVTRGPLSGERQPQRQRRFAGSLRQRRGQVLEQLRTAPVAADALPSDAVESLVKDGLVAVSDDGQVSLA